MPDDLKDVARGRVGLLFVPAPTGEQVWLPNVAAAPIGRRMEGRGLKVVQVRTP